MEGPKLVTPPYAMIYKPSRFLYGWGPITDIHINSSRTAYIYVRQIVRLPWISVRDYVFYVFIQSPKIVTLEHCPGWRGVSFAPVLVRAQTYDRWLANFRWIVLRWIVRIAIDYITALLRVLSDILCTADHQHITLLGLLDLSAAFDCVDHDILIQRLQRSFGIDGSVIAWIQSFHPASFLRWWPVRLSCMMTDSLSVIIQPVFCVPQCSVLGRYCSCCTLLSSLTLLRGPDWLVTYVSINNHAKFCWVVECIDAWMSSNRLKMNAYKMRLIWFGTRLDKLCPLGMRSFTVAGPVIWNSLPAALRSIATLSPLKFARHLKVHLFGWSTARLRTVHLWRSTNLHCV